MSIIRFPLVSALVTGFSALGLMACTTARPTAVPFDVPMGSPCEQITQRLGEPPVRDPFPGTDSPWVRIYDVKSPETYFPNARFIEVTCIKGKLSAVSIRVDRDLPADSNLKTVVNDLSQKYSRSIAVPRETENLQLDGVILSILVQREWFELMYIRTDEGN